MAIGFAFIAFVILSSFKSSPRRTETVHSAITLSVKPQEIESLTHQNLLTLLCVLSSWCYLGLWCRRSRACQRLWGNTERGILPHDGCRRRWCGLSGCQLDIGRPAVCSWISWKRNVSSHCTLKMCN
jgi:hypothetical protein